VSLKRLLEPGLILILFFRKVLYKKDGAAKEGCVLDLVATENKNLDVYIGIKYSNSECLATHNM